MNTKRKINLVEAALKQAFIGGQGIAEPPAENWKRRVMQEIALLDYAELKKTVRLEKFEKKVWHIALASFAASTVAAAIFIGVVVFMNNSETPVNPDRAYLALMEQPLDI
ncbi:MAG: hypothetical protein WC071_14400 [Victivallaceae bacterium]